MARLPRNLWLLGVVSLLADASTEMVFPLLPLYLTTLGGTGLAVGLMEGVAESVASFLKLASGRLSDRWRRRKGLTLAGYGFSAITKLGYPLAGAAWHVLGLRAADRLGKGVRGAPRDALVADSVPPARRGFAFGFHRALDTVGALLGPLAAAALVGVLTLRGLFLVAAVPALVAFAILFGVREAAPPRGPPRAAVPFPRTPAIHSYLLTVAVFTLGNFGLLFLLLRAAETGLSPRTILGIYALYNLVYAALALPLGHLSDRVGRVPLVAASFAALAAAAFTAARIEPTAWPDFLAPAALFGLSSAAFEGNGRALAADLAPAEARASVLGAYHAAIGLAALPGGLLAGLLWDLHPRTAFLAGGLFALVALLELVWLWGRGAFPGPPGPAGAAAP